MGNLSMTNTDEITMRLVHYFVTKENYQPIVVNGLENEIWLENVNKHYEVIRINSNYIHNDEQLNFDLFKAKTVIKQIKKKMLSINCNTLNIMLNIGENVKKLESNYKHMDILKIESVKELEEGDTITALFPEIKNDHIEAADDMDFFINVTQDINETTEKNNKLYEKTFGKKSIIVTYVLIVINVIVYLLQMAGVVPVYKFGMSGELFKMGNYWTVLTSCFMHGGIIHLFCNMYSLYVIGTQLETVLGKIKFIAVYLISAIIAALTSGVLNNGFSVGASGAIFGLVGALIYFGYHYRIYLGNVITNQLVPIVLLNLVIGFMLPGIDNFAHIGGLIGGVFAGMIVGIEGKTKTSDRVNGIIVTVILAAFLVFMIVR